MLRVSPETWAFGVFRNEKLIGTIRLVRDESEKEQHKASVFGLYVAARERRKGVARRLMQAVLDEARKAGVRQLRLSVTPGGAAEKLYAGLGFIEWGRERDSLQISGRFYDEVYMARRV